MNAGAEDVHGGPSDFLKFEVDINEEIQEGFQGVYVQVLEGLQFKDIVLLNGITECSCEEQCCCWGLHTGCGCKPQGLSLLFGKDPRSCKNGYISNLNRVHKYKMMIF